MEQIATSVTFGHSEKGRWVFRQGDVGDCMYIVLHGKCVVLSRNKQYKEVQRTMRECIQNFLDIEHESLVIEEKLKELPKET